MSMAVLKNMDQVREARRAMVARGASAIDAPWTALLRKLRLVGGVGIGDYLKSWDVWESVQFLERNVPKDAPILDIGCYASEVLVSLHRVGFTNLAGIDLNPALDRMPHQGTIRYQVGDFLRTPYPDGSFAAITSISVIEHGYDGPALCREASRLLKPGGYLVMSFDYWPEKIDTTGIRIFGMTWTLFSRGEIQDLVAEAGRHGLSPVGELKAEAQDAPIDFGGKKYTFGWLVLRKSGGP